MQKYLDENKIENLIIDNNKIDTLRSTSYLLLYNLIESTIYNSIITIFDDINDKGLKYFDIIEEIQKYWLNNLYKHDDKKLSYPEFIHISRIGETYDRP